MIDLLFEVWPFSGAFGIKVYRRKEEVHYRAKFCANLLLRQLGGVSDN